MPPSCPIDIEEKFFKKIDLRFAVSFANRRELFSHHRYGEKYGFLVFGTFTACFSNGQA
jgi:hypothetical protein